MTLGDSVDGQLLSVVGTDDDDITCQALRFGIGAGACIKVQKNIAGGPVIIAKNQLEIAIGRRLANSIRVSPIHLAK